MWRWLQREEAGSLKVTGQGDCRPGTYRRHPPLSGCGFLWSDHPLWLLSVSEFVGPVLEWVTHWQGTGGEEETEGVSRGLRLQRSMDGGWGEQPRGRRQGVTNQRRDPGCSGWAAADGNAGTLPFRRGTDKSSQGQAGPGKCGTWEGLCCSISLSASSVWVGAAASQCVRVTVRLVWAVSQQLPGLPSHIKAALPILPGNVLFSPQRKHV